MLSAMPRRLRLPLSISLAALVVVALGACERRGGCTGSYCGTLIDAAIGEPGTLLPPSTEEVVARDIEEQLFLKLADVGMSTNTVGDEDFQPLLAQRWEWDGPLTLVFHIDPRARWQDGPRVTATDVAFTFDAYNDSAFSLGRPAIRRLIWRFTPDLGVAVSQVIADQADVREQIVTPENRERLRAAQQIALSPYRGNVYAFLSFNLRADGDTAMPNPIFADREVRRALGMAIDRASLVRSTLGELGKVPPGPMSSLLWIWDPEIRQLPFDTAQAARILNARGWRDHDGDGIRDRAGQPLAFHILVPTTSVLRKQYARLLQEEYRAIGVRVDIDEVENSVVGQRVGTGHYDTAILSRANDPSPSSGISQTWTRAGFGGSNFRRYGQPGFHRLVDRAIAAASRDEARRLGRDAVDLINADAPAVFLYSLENMAALPNRVDNVQLRPDSWAALLRTWRIPSSRLIDRDRVER